MMGAEIRGMILAAGFGERMQREGERTPKPLVKVGAKPLIYYPLWLFARAGFNEIIINLHHQAEEIKKELGESLWGMKIHYLLEPEILGTGGGIKNANKFYPAELWLIINADTIIDLDLKTLIRFHKKSNPLATMVLTKAQLGEFNPVFADAKARVRAIGSKPKTAQAEPELSPYNFCGVQLIKKDLLDYLPEGYSKIIEAGYQKALEKEARILGYIFSGLWLPIDTPSARSKAEQEFLPVLLNFFNRAQAKDFMP